VIIIHEKIHPKIVKNREKDNNLKIHFEWSRVEVFTLENTRIHPEGRIFTGGCNQ
jgi:hypothetical protein